MVFPVPLSGHPRPLWYHPAHALVGEACSRLTPEVPCGISRRFASKEKARDWNEVVRGSLFDAASFCRRCWQREEDGDELPGETEGKQQSEFHLYDLTVINRENLLTEHCVFLPNYLKRTHTWHSLNSYTLMAHMPEFSCIPRGDVRS